MFEAATHRISELTARQLLISTAKLLIPLSLAGAYVAYVSTFAERGQLLLPLLAAYFFPPLGKESVIPLGISLGIHPALVAFSVAMVDVLVGLFLLWNYRFLYYVPLLGKWVKKMEIKAQKMIEEGKGFSKLAWLGLVLFVIVPFQGSGAVSATVIGKISGIEEKRVWLAVITGAFAGTFMVAYSFNLILATFQTSFWVGLAVVAVAAALIVFLYHRLRRMPESRASLRQIRDFTPLAANGGTVVPDLPEEPPIPQSYLE